MQFNWFNRLLKRKSRSISGSARKATIRRSFLPAIESLSERIVPAVTASFTPGASILTITGDNLDNTITVSRDAAGKILVNGGAVTVKGGTATIANTATISVFGLGGNDNITLSESNGALPKAQIFGGNGNDTLTGGSGADLLFGEVGNDILLGKGGADLLFGGAGDDSLTGGDADDQIFGQAGNDRMIWNPGDDTDLNEGGDGSDTVEVNGGNGDEAFTVTPNGTRVRFDRINPAPFSIDIGSTEKLNLNMNGGDDKFTGSNGLAALLSLTVDGGTGNDTITGSDGNDVLLGGDGNDQITGGRGNDTEFLGAGDDTTTWNPGDGNDTIEGQEGVDTLIFNGANVAENIVLAPNGSRTRLTRDIANIVMDVNGLEAVNVNALGGADVITVGDLSGTGVTKVNIDLGASAGTAGGDTAIDSIVVAGTNAANNVQVFGAGSSYQVIGLSTLVNVSNSEGARDSLLVNLLAGNDTFDAVTLPAGVIAKLSVDGGAGNDTIQGSQAADLIQGGDGDDSVNPGRGNDTVFLGAGNDVTTWSPGDGDDVIEGQDGIDLLVFNGSNVSEKFEISANANRVRFTRDVANITMDLNDVEQLDVNALGGADSFVVGDLSGTDLTTLNVNLRGPDAAGDGAADSVTLNGSNAADTVQIVSIESGAAVAVTGLKTVVNIRGSEGANDKLTFNAQGGDDNVNASNLSAGLIGLTLNGGLGNDILLGSAGADLISGGDGDDTLLMGAGDDTAVWNPGDDNDVIEGQDGVDLLQFNGANVSEKMDLSANGARLRLARDVANVVLDLNDVEVIDIVALGGADTITVNDLSGTDVTELNFDLASTAGGSVGDGQADAVIINGTNGDDTLVAAGDASGVSLFGLSAQVNIRGAEAANDRLTVNALAGADVLDASGLIAAAIKLAADGGDGDDVLIGGDGSDTLFGGKGDDVLIGGLGQDVLDGGVGDNVVIQ